MRLENIRGKSNIENFISDREKEINIKTKAKVTSVTDDAQKLTPSCSHTKNTCSDSTVNSAEDPLPSNEKNSNLNTLSDDFLAVQGPSKNQKNHLEVPETVTVRHYSYHNGKPEQESDILVQVQTTLSQNEVTSVNADTIDESKDHELKLKGKNFKHDEYLAEPGTSSTSTVHESPNKIKKDVVKDYEYWKHLYLKTFFSSGIGARTREKFEYYLKKMKEAKLNGIAEDEEKNFTYWYRLFMDRYLSDRIDDECKEDLEYFHQMMKETKTD